MGLCQSCYCGEPSDFKIEVKTMDRIFAGTDANVGIILYDDIGNRSDPIALDNLFRNDFERGRTDSFSVPRSKLPSVGLGKITRVELWRDTAGLAPDWYAEKITVKNRVTKDVWEFPVLRWIRPHYRYLIEHLDTSLPQFDIHKDQRQIDLENTKKLYQYDQKAPGMPVQIKSMPPDEFFSFAYKWDIIKTKFQLIASSKIVRLTAGEWESLGHLVNVYTRKIFNKPMGADKWSNDLHFGLQRIASQNHSLIRLCTKIPDKLAVTEEMLKPLLEGETLDHLLSANRLFTCDLDILEGLPCGERLTLCKPIALFLLNSNKQLVPIAIQLFQNPGPDNPVFMPTDHPNTWKLAKMWYNNSDAAFHQALAHLGFTHLLMEGVTIATHRTLSLSHPMFKLMAPHLLYLIAINSRGLALLVSPGGWVDKTMNYGRPGMFELIIKGCSQWRMDVEGTLPEDLKERGLDDPSILPCYHFREDALLIYKAINDYITRYVNYYYDTPEKLAEDSEIQAWGQELARDKEEGGVGILGVPGGGHFTTNAQLIQALTSVVYTCSVSHASTNFPQYEEYAFPPNYPALMRGEPPRDKSAKTEQDILRSLPDKPTTLDMMVVTKILSNRGTNSLGNFEVQYIFDPEARHMVNEFRDNLQKISQIVKDRNKTRNPPYLYLDPEIVPNSISI